MQKVIIVTMPDRTRWAVPATVVAQDRAQHLAKRDSARGYGTYDAVYSEEFAATLADTDELLDWAANNMNWTDVKPHATPYPPIPITEYEEQDAWVNGSHEVLEQD